MSGSFTSWLPSFPFVGRSSHVPQRSDRSDSSTTLPNPALPLSPSNEKRNIWDEDQDADEERTKFFGPRSHPLFDRAALEDSPPSSPAVSDPSSDDDDVGSFVSIQRPRPISLAARAGAPLHLVLDDHNPSTDPEETGSSRSGWEDDVPPSPTPSLVPTIIASRPPTPRPQSCVAKAEALGIKVRDFAYEEHGVPLARPVPDVETLRARYQLYRSADLTPPSEIVETLRSYDIFWLEEQQRFFDEKEQASLSKPPDNIPWRHHRGLVWCGTDPESVAMSPDAPKDSYAVEDPVADVTTDLASLTVKADCSGSGDFD